jgi:hypothetical protein
MEQNSNNIPELQSPFEQLREVDADGKEWWNSRKLARVMGCVIRPIPVHFPGAIQSPNEA